MPIPMKADTDEEKRLKPRCKDVLSVKHADMQTSRHPLIKKNMEENKQKTPSRL
jgi:hypothetical protein